MEAKEKIILGIDPGTRYMGYGVIEVLNGNLKVLQYGIIDLTKYKDAGFKLGKIFQRVTSIIEEFAPDEVALEAPFFGKNIQSMLKLGRAQGVAMASALAHEIPITEYSPKSVKQAVTGNGNASKEQVAYFLETILKIKLETKMFDATDALGIAVCHHLNTSGMKKILSETKSSKSTKITTAAKKKGNSWETFIQSNQDRVIKKD